MKNQILKKINNFLMSLDGYQGIDPLEVLAKKSGIREENIIRLNGNENLYGPSPKTLEKLSAFKNYNFYPDPQQRILRKALSGYINMSEDCIVAGNGCDELIEFIIRMFLKKNKYVMQFSPTFGMYSFSVKAYGGKILNIPRLDNFKIDIDKISTTSIEDLCLIFVASPNNPTGNLISTNELKKLLSLNVPVVIDETYYEFAGETIVPMIKEYENLIVLRTFSKWAGLAGLRLGFAIMNPNVAEIMMKLKSPYNINVAAQEAVLTSLDDLDVLMNRIKKISLERERITKELNKFKEITPYPSKANFIFCKIENKLATFITTELAKKGIFIRHFNSPDIENFIRISLGMETHNNLLIQNLKEILEVKNHENN